MANPHNHTSAFGAVHFPVVSANGVELETVQCILSPRERVKKSFVINGPDPVEIEKVLGEARSTEQHENSAFSVNVRFIPNQFSDASYTLALAIADKWARGCWKKLPDKQAIYATGMLETGGSGVLTPISHFKEKLHFMSKAAAHNAFVVVPMLNIDQLAEVEINDIQSELKKKGSKLLAIRHINELNALWGIVEPKSHTPSRHNNCGNKIKRRWLLPSLGAGGIGLLLVGIAWIAVKPPEEQAYKLSGGSADRLWCASATFPNYLATWQVSNQKPDCKTRWSPQEQELLDILTLAQSETGYSADKAIYNRYSSLNPSWLNRLTQKAPSSANQLLMALTARVQGFEKLRQQAAQLHSTVQLYNRELSYYSAQKLSAALANLGEQQRQLLIDDGIDLLQLEVLAEKRLKNIQMQIIAVDYYWQKYRAGGDAVPLKKAADALGLVNWELLEEEIHQALIAMQ